MTYQQSADYVVNNDQNLTVRTPHGVIFITCGKFTGTGVVVYDDPEENPIASVRLKKLSEG